MVLDEKEHSAWRWVGRWEVHGLEVITEGQRRVMVMVLVGELRELLRM